MLNHVSKRGPRSPFANRDEGRIGNDYVIPHIGLCGLQLPIHARYGLNGYILMSYLLYSTPGKGLANVC